MYMFIAIVFIAELIIFFQLISLIMKIDKKVCDINSCVKEFNPLAKTYMQYLRCLTSTFLSKLNTGIEFVKKQREKFIFKSITTVALYCMLLLFRLKKVRLRRIGNLVGAIRDILLDLTV